MRLAGSLKADASRAEAWLQTAAKVPHHRNGCLIDPRWASKLFWDFFVPRRQMPTFGALR